MSGPTYAVQPDAPLTLDPAEIAANRDDWLTDVERRHLAMSRTSTARLLLVAAVPLGILGVFFVLPVAGMISTGFWTDGTFDPVGVLEVLGRPRVHRVLWFTLWSATLGTLLSLALGPARRARAVPPPRARWEGAARGAAGAVRAADRGGRRGLPRAASARAGRSASSASTAPRSRSSPGWCSSTPSVVIRVVGGAWEVLDPRPAEAAAALGATPLQVLRTVTLPALRPAIVSAASVVFLFCATVVRRGAHPGRAALQLGGDRDLPAHHQPARPPGGSRAVDPAAGRGRRTAARVGEGASYAGPVAGPGRRPGRGRLDRGDLPALARDRSCWRLLVAAPILALVVGSLRNEGGWSLANYRALATTGEQQAVLAPVTEALVTSLRTAVDATWMSLLLGLLRGGRGHPALAVDGRAPAAHGVRRAVHAAPRGLGRDARIRLPDHPRRAAPRPARLAVARARRPGAGGAAPRRPHARSRARQRRRPAPPGSGHAGRPAVAGRR